MLLVTLCSCHNTLRSIFGFSQNIVDLMHNINTTTKNWYRISAEIPEIVRCVIVFVSTRFWWNLSTSYPFWNISRRGKLEIILFPNPFITKNFEFTRIQSRYSDKSILIVWQLSDWMEFRIEYAATNCVGKSVGGEFNCKHPKCIY